MLETIMWLWEVRRPAGYPVSPLAFATETYQRHNRRRQEHLATLDLPFAGKSVLELGGGIGDHTTFFLDRGCRVTLTDGRPENIDVVQQRYPTVPSLVLDIETCEIDAMPAHQIVYSYGLLYHLSDPERALALSSAWAEEMLLLETCVSYGDELAINPIGEDDAQATQALSGTGCRPTRGWIRAELGKHFDYVYMPLTQPAHDDFPNDWSSSATRGPDVSSRCVFVASRSPLASAKLTLELPTYQPPA